MKLDDVVKHFLIDCENRRLSDGTIVLYRRVLGLLVHRLAEDSKITDLEEVRIVHLRQFLHFLFHSDESNKRFPNHYRQEKLAPTTVRNYVIFVKAFFHWCVVEELLTTDPAARLSKPKVPQHVTMAFTAEHIEKMLATCDTGTNEGFRDYVLLLTLLDTGMRVSELCNLCVADVYDRHIKVMGKGRKEREIGLHPEVSKLLWKYIHKYRRARDPDEDHVFIGKRGAALKISGVEALFNRVERKSGITGVRVSPHTLRHTFAKWYLMRGGEIFKLSRELGHSGIQITGNTYLGDFNSTNARQDHESFSPIGDLRLSGRRKSSKGKKDT
jgi:integrase/recombinase XerD